MKKEYIGKTPEEILELMPLEKKSRPGALVRILLL